MEFLKGKKAVVTGVSKGIGLEIARQLLNAEVEVTGWGRTAPDLVHERFHFVLTDVTDYASVEQAYAQTLELAGKQIHILVNNAGYGVFAPVDELSVEDWKGMFDVNVHGLMYCTRVMVPGMKAMDEGHIVNISSIAGLNGVKNMSGYVATKHAVRGFSHSLMLELRDWGIKVTTVYPGSVKTNFFDDINGMEAHDHMMRAEDVARSVVDLLNSHPNYLPADLEIRPLRPKGKQ